MEELPLDLIAELGRQPVKKPRSSKKLERTFRSWFYEVETHYGICDNESCIDPRNKAAGTAMVWASPRGLKMCRFDFLAGWLEDE